MTDHTTPEQQRRIALMLADIAMFSEDHEPDGCPAVRMRTLTECADIIRTLSAELAQAHDARRQAQESLERYKGACLKAETRADQAEGTLAQARAELKHVNEHTIPRLFQQRDQQWERAQGLAAELEGLKAQGQWISVKDRLPAEGQPVLFIVKSSDHLNGRLLGGVFRNTAGMPGFSTQGVTYGASDWMPAPPAPPTGEV